VTIKYVKLNITIYLYPKLKKHDLLVATHDSDILRKQTQSTNEMKAKIEKLPYRAQELLFEAHT
jgi:hypothetical protein